jgi:ribosomal protein S18 acetylase RimI-like enzyme
MSNAQAISLYHKSGFTELGIRKGYYKSPPEDALVMGRVL